MTFEILLLRHDQLATHSGASKRKMGHTLGDMVILPNHLPKGISPDCSEKREGFTHPHEIKGDASMCSCHLIVRDFEEEKIKNLCAQVEEIAALVAQKDERLKVDVEIKFSYPNMIRFINKHPEIAERLTQAVVKTGIQPVISPIRGSTDGSNLSRKGLPTPNIFTGGMNFHSPSEWISTRSMGLSTCTVLNLLKINSD